MLKRSKVLVMLLVITVLCASIGFAALSDTLNVSGKLSMNIENSEIVEEFNADVYFQSVKSQENGITASVNSEDDDLVDIAIDNTVLTKVNDTAVVIATIKNAGEYAVTLKTPTTVNTEIANYATVTAQLAATELAAGETTTLTITVTLTAIPANSFDDYAFSAAVVAEPKQ